MWGKRPDADDIDMSVSSRTSSFTTFKAIEVRAKEIHIEILRRSKKIAEK
jgi:hypothetical protein